MVAWATEGAVSKSNNTIQAAPSKPAADAIFWPGLQGLAFSTKFIMVISRMSTSEFEAAYFVYRSPTISDSDHVGQYLSSLDGLRRHRAVIAPAKFATAQTIGSEQSPL